MFDIAPSELLVLGTVALLVIPPKDLPKAMRVAGYWVGRARSVARQFRAGFDDMLRDAELKEMEARWKAENERIMREHSSAVMLPSASTPEPGHEVAAEAVHATEDGPPVMVEKPVVAGPAIPAVEPAKPAADPAS